jgi:hypothetical protein
LYNHIHTIEQRMFNSELPAQSELPGTGRLIRSTLLAMAGALLLLITIVLPAEYGIDPTGIGQRLGLTALAHANPVTDTDLSVVVNTPTDDWRDDISVTIPGYGQAELKLTMQQDEKAVFEWHTDGESLAVDVHGDGAAEQFISYETLTTSDHAGELTAGFTGTHGWYWQNKSRRSVEVTLRTKGNYSALKRVL